MPNQKRRSSGSPRALSNVVPRSSARLKLSTRPAIMRKGRALPDPVDPPATTTGKTGTMHGETPVMNPPRNTMARSSPTTEVGLLAGTPHCHCSASRRVGRCTRLSIDVSRSGRLGWRSSGRGPRSTSQCPPVNVVSSDQMFSLSPARL